MNYGFGSTTLIRRLSKGLKISIAALGVFSAARNDKKDGQCWSRGLQEIKNSGFFRVL